MQGRHLALAYQLVKETGPDHCKSFEVAVMINGKKIAVGTGRTKKKQSSRQRMRQFLLCGRNEVRDVFKKFGGTWL